MITRGSGTYGEREIVESMASRCAQHGFKADGNVIVRDIVAELERSGVRLPESTKFVLRSAAAGCSG
ncbi:hypothetical protein OKW29_003246 [Paraburkholderia sp. CI3]